MKKLKAILATMAVGGMCMFGGCFQQAKDGCDLGFDNGSFVYDCSGAVSLPGLVD